MKKLLDLFCCGGGAGRGYQLAGFDVTGIDIAPQPGYPGKFVQADAFEYLMAHAQEFDLIHLSPPCQGYSPHVSSQSSKWVPTLGKDEPRLLSKCLTLAQDSGVPFVIENVMGARSHMSANLILCGTMFGLPISRHRIFYTSFLTMQPSHPFCSGVAKRFAEARGWEYRDMSVTGKGRRTGTTERWKEIMGIDWALTQHQLAEAIPPAYTRYVGGEFLKQNP